MGLAPKTTLIYRLAAALDHSAMVVALDHSTRGWAHKKNSTNEIWNKRFFVYTKSNDPKIMGLIKSYTNDPVRNAGKPVKTYQVEFRSRSGQRFKAIDDAPGQRPNRLNVHIIDRAGGELHLAFGEDYNSIACGASLFGAILASQRPPEDRIRVETAMD